MPTAFNLVPPRFADGRHTAIMQGLAATGYAVLDYGYRRGTPPGDWIKPSDERDVLVTWTVHKGALEACRDFFETHAGRVIVAEEAHLRRIRSGPYPDEQYFSLCLHDHQDQWRPGRPERWASWSIDLKPWKTGGRKVLVREQRSIGSKEMASPNAWHTATANSLRREGAEVEIVTHPKTLKRQGRPVPAPSEQFADAKCVITWASHMGTQALVHGVPVIHRAPRFFLADASSRDATQWQEPPTPDRKAAFERFAWAQWAMSEIRSGIAFDHLLRAA